MALYDRRQHHALAFGAGLDPSGRDHGALVLWLLGYPDQAMTSLQGVLTLAQERPHPFSLAVARVFAAMFHQLRRDPTATRQWAESALETTTQHGFALFRAFAVMLRGWAVAAAGHHADGISELRDGLEAQHATGAELLRPYFFGMLAEALAWAGRNDEALTTVADALSKAQATEEGWWLAELHRLQGEVLAQRSGPTGATTPEAEACFRRALEHARGQSAKSLELRAAVSLGRLWQRDGRRETARELLAGIHGWFTEGFDTADLRESVALLAELS
jgi:predicted ATPase